MQIIDGPSLIISYKDRIALHSVLSSDIFHLPIVLYSQIDQLYHSNLYDFHCSCYQHNIQYHTTNSSLTTLSRYNNYSSSSSSYNKSMLFIRLSLVPNKARLYSQTNHIIEWIVINTKSLHDIFLSLYASNDISNNNHHHSLCNHYRLCRSEISNINNTNNISSSINPFYYRTIYLTNAKIAELFQNILESLIPGLGSDYYMNETSYMLLPNMLSSNSNCSCSSNNSSSSSYNQMIEIAYASPTVICSSNSNKYDNTDNLISDTSVNPCMMHIIILDNHNTLYYYHQKNGTMIKSFRRLNHIDTKCILSKSIVFSMKIIISNHNHMSTSISSSNRSIKKNEGLLILQYHTSVLLFDIMNDFTILKEFSNIDSYLCDYIFDPFEYYLLFIPTKYAASSGISTNNDAKLMDTNSYDHSVIMIPQSTYHNYHNRKAQAPSINSDTNDNTIHIADNNKNNQSNVLHHWFVYELPFYYNHKAHINNSHHEGITPVPLSRSMCNRGIWREDQLRLIDGYLYCTMTTSINLKAIKKHLLKNTIHKNHYSSSSSSSSSNDLMITNTAFYSNKEPKSSITTTTNTTASIEVETSHRKRRSYLTVENNLSVSNKKHITNSGTITVASIQIMEEDDISCQNNHYPNENTTTTSSNSSVESSLCKYLEQLKKTNQQIKEQIRFILLLYN